MFGWLRKEALLDAELTAWQFDCFDWLLRHTGGVEALQSRTLILPTRECFPQRGQRDTAFAVAVFEQVKVHAGMADWPCTLQMQEGDPNPMVSPQAFIKDAPQSPAGTFRALGEEGALITYHPNQLADPVALVATFAHELAHYRTAGFPEPPPGGWEVWEIATDLAAVFLGFGVFLANTRFQFGHFSDGRVSGWRWRQQGYVSEPEVLHMQAIVSQAMGAPQEQTLAHLKPALRGIYKRVWKDAALASGRRQPAVGFEGEVKEA
jgi:hypothetical protein